MNLLWIVGVPLLAGLAIVLAPARHARMIALGGAILQMALVMSLYFSFTHEREVGNVFPLLFEKQYQWFPSLGFSLHIGVDGISVAMMMLTAFVVVAGVLVSWRMEHMKKEFFFFLTLLAFGAYGFYVDGPHGDVLLP